MNLDYKSNVKKLRVFACSLIILTIISGCKKFVMVDAPVTSVNGENIFNTDASAASVLAGTFTKMIKGGITNEMSGLSFYPGLSSDELTLFPGASSQTQQAYYKNALINVVQNSDINFWFKLYPVVYSSNSAIEGLNKSTKLTPAVKNHLLGEALFVRAFCYFYLTNLYGDVPLALTTDYKVNSSLPKSDQKQVYAQIVTDLKAAKALLSDQFLMSDANTPYAFGAEERVRPNKWAASAMLARVYLYNGQYSEAQAEADNIIAQGSLFHLASIEGAFLKNNTEAIWQLQPVNTDENTPEALFYVIPSSGPNDQNPVYLSDGLVNQFEPGDLRKEKWTANQQYNGKQIFFPYKYKVNERGKPLTEYSTVLRLAEQYLIRAESKCNQNDLPGAIADLNIIRERSRAAATALVPNPLPPLLNTLTKESILIAIAKERQTELFTEWGHRWLDIKRTGEADKIMPAVTARKGGHWDSNWKLYPIPQEELGSSITLKQNPGY